jgi:hypothetical protein
VQKLARENAALAEANKPMVELEKPPAPPPPGDSEGGDDEEERDEEAEALRLVSSA